MLPSWVLGGAPAPRGFRPMQYGKRRGLQLMFYNVSVVTAGALFLLLSFVSPFFLQNVHVLLLPENKRDRLQTFNTHAE